MMFFKCIYVQLNYAYYLFAYSRINSFYAGVSAVPTFTAFTANAYLGIEYKNPRSSKHANAFLWQTFIPLAFKISLANAMSSVFVSATSNAVQQSLASAVRGNGFPENGCFFLPLVRFISVVVFDGIAVSKRPRAIVFLGRDGLKLTPGGELVLFVL